MKSYPGSWKPTPNQLRILDHLRQHGQSYQYAIEQELEFQRGMGAAYLLRLAQRGWIEECPPPAEAPQSGRGLKYYRLTPAGEKIIAASAAVETPRK